MIKLGDRVKDKVTGFTGVAVCRTEWLNKCIRIGVQPEKVGKDGKVPEAAYFDIEQLALVKSNQVKLEKEPTGGPMPDPQQRREPRR